LINKSANSCRILNVNIIINIDALGTLYLCAKQPCSNHTIIRSEAWLFPKVRSSFLPFLRRAKTAGERKNGKKKSYIKRDLVCGRRSTRLWFAAWLLPYGVQTKRLLVNRFALRKRTSGLSHVAVALNISPINPYKQKGQPERSRVAIQLISSFLRLQCICTHEGTRNRNKMFLISDRKFSGRLYFYSRLLPLRLAKRRREYAFHRARIVCKKYSR